MLYGWQCPVCGRVLSPFMMECPCGGKPYSTTFVSTGTSNWKTVNQINAEKFESWTKKFNQHLENKEE